MALAHGAIGILSDWSPQPDSLPDAVFWNNAFSDDPGGWGQVEGDHQLVGFAISPQAGRDLRARLAHGEVLRVAARADTAFLERKMPIVHALLPGTGREEILLLGHGFEQGAADNCSSVACMIEVGRCLETLIRKRILPPPKRGIRFLVTNECFGTLAYVHRYPGRIRNTLAGLCLDDWADDLTLPGEALGLYRTPRSAPGIVDAFCETAAGAVWGGRETGAWETRPFCLTDNLIAHSSVGVPTIWLGKAKTPRSWHLSADTPDRLSSVNLRRVATYAAAYAYTLATVGDADVLKLAEALTREAEAAITAEARSAAPKLRGGFPRKTKELEADIHRRIAFHSTVHALGMRDAARWLEKPHGQSLRQLDTYARSIDECALAQTATRGETYRFGLSGSRADKRLFPKPKYKGPITNDPLPLPLRKTSRLSRWGGVVNMALGWADGTRSLAEIVDLTECEAGRKLPGLSADLRQCIRHGLIDVANA
jgi:hypothetical protein